MKALVNSGTGRQTTVQIIFTCKSQFFWFLFEVFLPRILSASCQDLKKLTFEKVENLFSNTCKIHCWDQKNRFYSKNNEN